MGNPGRKYHQWQRRKKRNTNKYQRIWYYEQPFKENEVLRSAATVPEDTNVLEIYYHVKREEYMDIRATERRMGRALKELIGCGRYICKVDYRVPLVTVGFYSKVEELPSPEKMEEVPAVINDSLVEAGIDRWDYRTKEYQGRYYLSDFSEDHRHQIRKFCEGRHRGRQVLGSIWAFARG